MHLKQLILVCVSVATPTPFSFVIGASGRLVMRIMSADFDPLPSQYSDDLSDVIKRMLALNPDDRPSVSELLEFPIVREAREGLAAGVRNSVDLTAHHCFDGIPLSYIGVSQTEALTCVSEAAQPCRGQGLSIDASIQNLMPSLSGPSVSPISPVGSEGGLSSLTSPQLPECAVAFNIPSQMPNSTDLSQIQQHHVSENYADDFEPEPDDAWEAQLPRSRTASSEIENIQEEEGALRSDSAGPPDFIEDECSDGSYEDDFDVEQDVAIPAVKLNGSICAIPIFETSCGGGRFMEVSADQISDCLK
jgi:serine/threonine protein kinase